MPFTNDETGFERSPTKLVLDREPRIMNRNQRSGPSRVSGEAISGATISVEYHQDGDRELAIALEKLTDAKTTTLRQLADVAGPLTFKRTAGVSTTYTVTIARIQIDPIVGFFTDGAPEQIRYHRAELALSILEMIP